MEKDKGLWAVVIKTVAPLKNKPEVGSDLVDEVLFGMVIKIVEAVNEQWYYVETHYGYHGYIYKEDILIDSKEALQWREKADAVVIHNLADVMSEPKYASCPLLLLTRGAFIQVVGEKGDWFKVLLPQRQYGWVRKVLLHKMQGDGLRKDEAAFRMKLVSTALSYLGTQYRWGGKSPLGIDCSGLCSMAYMLCGVIIYRDAVLKEEYMRSISIEEIKPGDLLFFPGHVAMYIGEDKYVHATGKEGLVLINSLNPEHVDYREDLHKDISGIGTIF